MLFISQCLASMAFIAGATVNPIISVELGGTRALAGLPFTLVVAGAAIAAYPIGWFTDQVGRRGLALGLVIGAAGALLAGIAVVQGWYLPFLLGLLLVGCARGAAEQTRFAAAEIYTTDQRARALSLIVFGGTIGAVAGPALISPSGRFVEQWWLPALSGPLFAGSLLLGLAAVLMISLLHPDPRTIGRQIAAQQNAAERAAADLPARSLRTILAQPAALLAVTAMVCAQASMVAIMAMTSLHMADYNHPLADIAFVIGAHTFGMFGLSMLTGWLTDRLGRPVMIMFGVGLLVTGALTAPISNATLPIAAALFLVGVGWNFCYVAGSALLSGVLRPAERGRAQGANDFVVAGSSALAGLGSGVVMAAVGFGWLCIFGALLAALPLLVMLRATPKTGSATLSPPA